MKIVSFSSDEFSWKGNTGTASLSNLTGGNCNGNRFERFTVRSVRTGHLRVFELDTSDAGYEDGWDGEFKVYTDHMWNGTKIVILND